MCKRLRVILAGCLAFVALGAPASSPYDGLNGRQIAEAIRKEGRPITPISNIADINRIIGEYACAATGGYRDYFSTSRPDAINKLSTIRLVAKSWWGTGTSDAAMMGNDLHNIFPCNIEVNSKRSDYVPGEVTIASYDNGYWRAGIGTIDGVSTNLYEPADELKGDFARVYLYMAAVYPQELWSGRGAMLYADGYFPLLTAYGRKLLLDWHRDDPVDDAERRRNDVIAAAQGNANPFVSEPELVEYVWGNHSDQVYGGDTGDDNDEESAPSMLKAKYSVEADKRIDLRSPYVAVGSSWTFDGKPVEGAIDLNSVSLGRHEIGYNNKLSRGKLIIFVEQ